MGETREHHSLSVPSSVQMFMPFEGAFVQLPLFPAEWELSCCRFSAVTLSLFLPHAAVVWDSGNRYSSILFQTMSLSSCVVIELKYKIATFTSAPGFLPGAGQNQEIERKDSKYLALSLPVCNICYEYTNDPKTPAILNSSRYRRSENFFLTKCSGELRAGGRWGWGEL